MKKIFLIVSAMLTVMVLNGCGSTVHPSIGTNGNFDDKTLNGNNVDFFTLLRIQNNYGTQTTITESAGKR